MAKLPSSARRLHGEYFTPAPLVQTVLSLAVPRVPAGPLTVVDPSCGDGAFLAAAGSVFPTARLCGLELDADHAAAARARLPTATVLSGDALRGGWDALVARLPSDGAELWVGNPPYNGTSSLLRDPAAYRTLRARLGLDPLLPPGTSVRDDYVFFLLLAAERLATRPGVLAWVTSATLLDTFLHAPLRRRLLDVLALEEVVDLGAGAFPGTRVRTCITVWSSHRGPVRAARFRVGGEAPVHFRPVGPEWALRPVPEAAARLDAEWRARGEPLDVLMPVSCSGLKTRFDELLVDDDRDALLARVDAFLRCRDVSDFARAHGLPERLVPKLRALRCHPDLPARAEPESIRPFHRWAGARHRGRLPASARAHCYLDRRLIPRGDHRLVGAFDPHRAAVKLVFNVRELPLAAALLERPGCVPAHRHARFAPLHVPARVLAEGPRAGHDGRPLGAPTANLSPAGRAWARQLGSPLAVYRAIVDFLNSPEVQEIWAPAFGRMRLLPVPLPRLLAEHLPSREPSDPVREPTETP